MVPSETQLDREIFRWEELAQIAARAIFLDERLGLWAAPASVDDQSRIAARLDRWCQVAADGDRAVFARRLAWDGLDLDAARRMVSPVQWRPGEPLPSWTGVLVAVASIAALNQADLADCRAFDLAEPLPFQELLVPFLLEARRRLAA